MSNLSSLSSSLGNSLNSGFLAKGVSAEFHSASGGPQSAVEGSSSSFTESLGGFLGKTVSGGLALASLGSAIALPGISFGLSKLGDSAGSSLLAGLLSSNTSGVPSSDLGSLAGIAAATDQMRSRHPYQAQPNSFPGASFITKA